jgi:hypothetical protein
MAEGEAFWATISTTAERFREDSPPGMAGVVEVEMTDGRTIKPAAVQRYPPWIILEAAELKDPGSREVLFVLEADIRSVHMRYEPGEKQGVGFTLKQPLA